MRNLPPLQWLKSFESAARLGSMTAAAKELSMTQAAMSRHIRLLEQWMGESLFTRIPRGLKLSEVGLALIPSVGAALDQMVTGLEQNRRYQGGLSITLKMPPSLASFWLPGRMHKLQSDFPDIQFRVLTEVWPRQNTIDADIEIRHGTNHLSHVTAMALGNDTIVAVVGNEPARRYDYDFERLLSSMPLISIMGYQQDWLHWSAYHDIDVSKANYIQTDSEPFANMLCRAGYGITLARSRHTEGLQPSEAVVALTYKERPLEPMPAQDGYFLISDHQYESSDTVRSMTIRSLCEWFRTAFNA